MTNVSDVISVVSSVSGIKPGDMLRKRRLRYISYPRFVAMKLAREIVGDSYPSIAESFGGMDHTSVVHGVRRGSELVENDERYAEIYDKSLRMLARHSLSREIYASEVIDRSALV